MYEYNLHHLMFTSRSIEQTGQCEIEINGEKLQEVTTFQYLGSTLNTDMTSITEIKKRLAMATTQLAKCDKIWGLVI